ncbi:hypothetical protein SNEBB_001990 [Seison nebaliae]|nr:hypothetical protein SNEBB_001990 [Seison nebaliae]
MKFLQNILLNRFNPTISLYRCYVGRNNVKYELPKSIYRLESDNRSTDPIPMAWVDRLTNDDNYHESLTELHPDIFHCYPRIDLIHNNVHWQQTYRKIDYKFLPIAVEMPGSNRKPWQQKGLGKARQGNIRNPQFIHGGKIHGPRGPKSYFFIEPKDKRVQGLCSTFTFKYHQRNLYIVDDLDIDWNDSLILEEMADKRLWGDSCLFVDVDHRIPANMVDAVNGINSFNILPVYSLNIYSMIKHESLVLTLAALRLIEERLVRHLYANDRLSKKYNKI